MDTDVTDRATAVIELIRDKARAEEEMAEILNRFSPEEYKEALPRMITETGWTRERLTALRAKYGEHH